MFLLLLKHKLRLLSLENIQTGKMFKQECVLYSVEPQTRNNLRLIKSPKLSVSIYSNGAKGPLPFHYHDNRTSETTIYAPYSA